MTTPRRIAEKARIAEAGRHLEALWECSEQMRNDGGLGVVRIKPLGAGGGGGERSAQYASASDAGVTFSTEASQVTVEGRRFTYPSHVISPEMDQQELYDNFMPARIEAFLQGINVNVMAYGQTGSGKTHTQSHLQLRAAQALLAEMPPGGQLFISFFENCGDANYDLLSPNQVTHASLRRLLWEPDQP